MGLSDDKLCKEWLNFVSTFKLYYHKSGITDNEAINLWDKTVDTFQERQGYADKTIKRITEGYLYDWCKDVWYKQFFGKHKFRFKISI